MTELLTVDVRTGPAERRRGMEADVRTGLAHAPRSIPPVWFYDETGSRLFDEITRLPEYYPTRCEREILGRHSVDIADASGATTLVEIGSGTSDKTRLLLDAMAASGQLERICLLDISEEVLLEAADHLLQRYRVPVHAVVGDLRTDLGAIPSSGRCLWAFLGGTIGNFEPVSRGHLLGAFAAAMQAGDSLLLGTDLLKDPGRLVAAYDDSRGVTARFNLNVLSVLNRELGADFDADRFAHRAVWDDRRGWIEMRLASTTTQQVKISALDLVVELDDGEEILTEISAKFDPGAVAAELRTGGLRPRMEWTDSNGDFLLSLASA